MIHLITLGGFLSKIANKMFKLRQKLAVLITLLTQAQEVIVLLGVRVKPVLIGNKERNSQYMIVATSIAAITAATDMVVARTARMANVILWREKQQADVPIIGEMRRITRQATQKEIEEFLLYAKRLTYYLTFMT